MLKSACLSLLRWYKKHLANVHLFGTQCRFDPTCSTFTYQAVERYGTIKGLWLGMHRILRCHPFYKGPLYDPVT